MQKLWPCPFIHLLNLLYSLWGHRLLERTVDDGRVRKQVTSLSVAIYLQKYIFSRMIAGSCPLLWRHLCFPLSGFLFFVVLPVIAKEEKLRICSLLQIGGAIYQQECSFLSVLYWPTSACALVLDCSFSILAVLFSQIFRDFFVSIGKAVKCPASTSLG